jgi:hypothetical protein
MNAVAELIGGRRTVSKSSDFSDPCHRVRLTATHRGARLLYPLPNVFQYPAMTPSPMAPG